MQKTEEMKHIEIYQKSNEILICATGLNEIALLSTCEPYFKLKTPDPDEIGKKTLLAFEASGKALAPENPGFDQLLQLAGVKSWSELVRGRSLLSARLNTQTLILVPCVKKGTAYCGIKAKKRTVPLGTAAEVGQAILEALEDCISRE